MDIDSPTSLVGVGVMWFYAARADYLEYLVKFEAQEQLVSLLTQGITVNF